MYLFSLGSGGWFLLLESIYLHFIKHTRFASPMQSMVFASSIYILTAALFNYIYIVKDRDQKIFGKYEDLAEKNPKQKKHLVLSMFVLALPYIVLITFAIMFPRPH
jgi:Na+/H+ antiporter NhaD/arsenite permease-like protein